MSLSKIRIATRRSPLALWQANYVKDLLQIHYPHLHVELLPLLTSGDKFLVDKLLNAGGKGLFVKELEEALLTDKADIAVHSTKDMPAVLPEGLCLPAFCKRHNPFDALISKHHLKLAELPEGAVIGTASLRRQAQLLAYRSDFKIKLLRGNVNTRLAKLEEEDFDAIILAAAGLERLDLEHKITEVLSPEMMLPTCGQGALSIECRIEDKPLQKIIQTLNDPLTALCVQTEREVNAQLGGNCHVPLAVFCTPQPKQELFLSAKIFSLDGTEVIQSFNRDLQEHASDLAQQCVQELKRQGADQLLSSISL